MERSDKRGELITPTRVLEAVVGRLNRAFSPVGQRLTHPEISWPEARQRAELASRARGIRFR